MAENKPNLELGIYRVRYTLSRGTTYIFAESDFIFRDDKLMLVFEWSGPENNQIPFVTVELDFSLLKECPGEPGYFLYSGRIEDPRTQQ